MFALATEDAIIVHKTEVVFCDKKTDKNRFKHYRLNAGNIEKVVYDYAYYKRFFGLKKELEEITERLPALAENTWNREKRRDYGDFVRVMKDHEAKVKKLLD